ncbi:putative conjugative DNA transfer protein [Agrobacterium tumefaciens str. Kerr 14]|uniref:Putative conjugative DNA transfer protein n=1 Tax=Agrobacterium tumefaciens str. Kerr 14 TaxID=1183424 RepID=A0A1S7SBE7_AGRTU|nr:TrbI/VirB10 family protein [Agrobacterium tumefaciens]CUX65889.1 putative conjugative DNA transfer protein [Agrobacterium tumefaciens str. Kerr 14]
MQDDKSQNQEPIHEGDQHQEEARLAAEREVLLNERRAKQTGKGKNRSRAMLAILLGGTAFVLFVTVGPSGVLKLLGTIGDGKSTSSVDMEVDREKDKGPHLDFTVPAPPEPPKEKPVDPNQAWNQRFKEMQDKLAEMERRKRPSADEIREMLSSYKEDVSRKLADERKAMSEENARLREAAQRAEEARRRAEEEASALGAASKEREKLDKKQRESDSVIVDERSNLGSNSDTSGAGSENAADLDRNKRFLKASASETVQTSVSQKLFDKSRMVVQGTIISAVLETAIDTQLPGNIRAQVMQPVYSFDGSRVLMPPGTMLVGQFNNDVDLAQKRVLIAWNRAVTPDGKSIAIGSTGTDTLGRAGTLGNVDNRYATKFGAAILISAINAVPTMLSQRAGGRSSGGDSSGTTVNIGGELASNAGKDLSDQSSSILEKYLSLPPVVRIPQGEEIRVFVNRDLIIR